MEKETKIVPAYLRKRRLEIVSLLIIIAIFISVFYLAEIPIVYVGYATMLSAFLIAILFGIDFFRFYRLHTKLKILKVSVLNNIDNWPEAADLIEQDYINIIENLVDTNRQQRIDYDERYIDMIDYYTLWAHQIKNPIAALRILIQGQDEAWISDLETELFKIEQYVEMVLSYLRVKSETTDYAFAHISLDKVVKEAIRKYSRLFIKKKIALEMEELKSVVLTDEKWLSFVIEQIISNSLKYTKKGKISISEQENKLIIKDTGIGIAPEDLPRVAEKGFTGFNGRTNKKSTGIGLYLCRNILSKLGHNIVIESRTGRGTTVTIEFFEAEIIKE